MYKNVYTNVILTAKKKKLEADQMVIFSTMYKN